MNDTMVTVVGNVATAVEFRDTATGGFAKFRFAATARRYDREKAVWMDGPTSFYTVQAWRALGANLAASVSVGDPLVVHGRLRVREEEWEGRRRTFVDVEALAVGHDLTRGTSAFRRVKAHERTGGTPAEAAPVGPGEDWPAGGAADGSPADGLAVDVSAADVSAADDPWATAPPPGQADPGGPAGSPAPARPAPDPGARARAATRRRHAEPVS
ncbi:single-stranded DNA-binding protein [Streptomyces sp. NPDC047097]|uniref:single-stranded DNA-binding protein n=1 Tax=Streptomyces sp. NPDC047097 TaxID=3155260 RepID=UPI0034079FD5